MRKLQFVLVAAMLAGSTTVAAAQDAQQQGQRPAGGRGFAVLMTGITLTAEQQVKFDAIAKKYADARTAIQSETDMEARRAKGRELSTKQAEEVKGLLTDEQKKVFEKNQEHAAAARAGGGRPPQA